MPLIPPDTRGLLAALSPIQQIKPEGPHDWQQRAAKTQDDQAIARFNTVRADAAEQDQADIAAIRQIAQETGGAPDKVLARLRTVSPTAAMKYEADWNDAKKKQFDAGKAEHEQEALTLKQNLGLIELAKARPELWPVIRQRVIANDPEMEPMVPQEYNAQAVEGIWKLGLDAEKLHAQEAKSLEYLVNGDWHRAAAMAFSTATDAGDADRIAGGLIQQGVPRDVVEGFGAWTPDFAARALQRGMTPDQRVDNERQATGQAITLAGQAETGRHNRAMEGHAAASERRLAAGGGDNGPLQAIVGPDGKPVLVARRDAIGKQPASGGAGGGTGVRGVTAGDAGRIAEYDTSLDDLGAVRAVLSAPGATGAVSAVEAYTPAFVTDLTGYGTGAKQRQAVIDRVKQVIGKALEGGVLRKEDEYKYEKILPTIRDAAPVVQSKLDGLESAIRKRRQTHLESLSDAGYNVSAYEQRTAQRAAAGPAAPAPAATSTPPVPKATAAATTAKTNPFRK